MTLLIARRWRLPLMVCLVAFLAALSLGSSRLRFAPEKLNQEIVKAVVAILQEEHLLRPRLDDELSRRWLQSLLNTFDPLKMYFLADDLAEFALWETRLDEAARRGDLTFAQTMRDRFVARHADLTQYALELIETAEFDFSQSDSLPTTMENLPFPADREEARQRLRLQLKAAFLADRVAGVPIEETRRRLRTRYEDRLRQVRLLDQEDLLEVTLSALTSAVDPHSRFLGPKTYEDMMQQDLQLRLEGIGARLRQEGGVPVIDTLIPGGAADRDGRLKPNDRVVGVELEDGSIVDFTEMKLSDAVRYIRGPIGSKVRLRVISASSPTTLEPITIELIRERIQLKDARASWTILEREDRRGRPIRLGLIRLPGFYGDSLAVSRGDSHAVSATRDLKLALNEFRTAGVDLVTLDLRGNPGGLLTEAETVTGLFIEQGPVVQIKDARGVTVRKDNDPSMAWRGPLVVLTSRASASASEIVAGALQDYHRALIVGDSATYGKGTVQQLYPLEEYLRLRSSPPLGVVKLTVQEFHRPLGAPTQKLGVASDVVLPSIRDAVSLGEATIPQAMESQAVPPQSLPPHDEWVTPAMIAQLNQASQQRRSQSPFFRHLERVIAQRRLNEQLDAIPLDETAYRALFAASPAWPDQDGPHEPPEQDEEFLDTPLDVAADLTAWSQQPVNQEVVEIMIDYLNLLEETPPLNRFRNPHSEPQRNSEGTIAPFNLLDLFRREPTQERSEDKANSKRSNMEPIR